MTVNRPRDLNWSFGTLVVALAGSLAGLLVALALNRAGVWPDWVYSEVIFGALCGALVVHRLHPGRLVLVLVVFVPVIAALLLLGRVLFHLYVMGEPIEL